MIIQSCPYNQDNIDNGTHKFFTFDATTFTFYVHDYWLLQFEVFFRLVIL